MCRLHSLYLMKSVSWRHPVISHKCVSHSISVIDDRKRQGQHKIPNTNMNRKGQDKTKVSLQHQPYNQALKYASFKSAFSIIRQWSAYMVVYISLYKETSSSGKIIVSISCPTYDTCHLPSTARCMWNTCNWTAFQLNTLISYQLYDTFIWSSILIYTNIDEPNHQCRSCYYKHYHQTPRIYLAIPEFVCYILQWCLDIELDLEYLTSSYGWNVLTTIK